MWNLKNNLNNNKSEKHKHYIIHMWKLFTKQNQTYSHKKQIYGYKRRKGGW